MTRKKRARSLSQAQFGYLLQVLNTKPGEQIKVRHDTRRVCAVLGLVKMRCERHTSGPWISTYELTEAGHAALAKGPHRKKAAP